DESSLMSLIPMVLMSLTLLTLLLIPMVLMSLTLLTLLLIPLTLLTLLEFSIPSNIDEIVLLEDVGSCSMECGLICVVLTLASSSFTVLSSVLSSVLRASKSIIALFFSANITSLVIIIFFILVMSFLSSNFSPYSFLISSCIDSTTLLLNP